MNKLGKKQLILDLKTNLTTIPPSIKSFDIQLKNQGKQLIYTYDTSDQHTGIATLLKHLSELEIQFTDLKTDQSSLEDIFVSLVKESP
jgi:ABC-2 type transport system ATP-binding protein